MIFGVVSGRSSPPYVVPTYRDPNQPGFPWIPPERGVITGMVLFSLCGGVFFPLYMYPICILDVSNRNTYAMQTRYVSRRSYNRNTCAIRAIHCAENAQVRNTTRYIWIHLDTYVSTKRDTYLPAQGLRDCVMSPPA